VIASIDAPAGGAGQSVALPIPPGGAIPPALPLPPAPAIASDPPLPAIDIAPLPAVTAGTPAPAIGKAIGAPLPPVIGIGPGVTWAGVVVGGAAEPAALIGWVIVGGVTAGALCRP
jgi:hypothetical protein